MSEDLHVVVAVVVTWNRCDLLGTALRAVLGQSRPPDRVVVVDNDSTDGTADLLRSEFSPERAATVEVLRTTRNIGGAGGFAVGVRRALESSRCDLLWLLDDDTIAEELALESLLAAVATYGGPQPALVASRVVWTDGRDHPMNTPRRSPWATSVEDELADRIGCLPIRSASFVSVLLDAAVVNERGLPLADYFLWNDDFEFTTRLIRGGVGLSCPASVVVHETATFASTDVDPGARFFYEVRNKVWLFTRARGLSPREKLGYGGATVLRWSRTIARSSNRRVLFGGLARGLLRGVLTAPKPTADILAEAMPTSDTRGQTR